MEPRGPTRGLGGPSRSPPTWGPEVPPSHPRQGCSSPSNLLITAGESHELETGAGRCSRVPTRSQSCGTGTHKSKNFFSKFIYPYGLDLINYFLHFMPFSIAEQNHARWRITLVLHISCSQRRDAAANMERRYYAIYDISKRTRSRRKSL